MAEEINVYTEHISEHLSVEFLESLFLVIKSRQCLVTVQIVPLVLTLSTEVIKTDKVEGIYPLSLM